MGTGITVLTTYHLTYFLYVVIDTHRPGPARPFLPVSSILCNNFLMVFTFQSYSGWSLTIRTGPYPYFSRRYCTMTRSSYVIPMIIILFATIEVQQYRQIRISLCAEESQIDVSDVDICNLENRLRLENFTLQCVMTSD